MSIDKNNEIEIFNFKGREVRVAGRNGNPWFINMDVCAELDIQNARQAIESLEKDDVSTIYVIDAIGRRQETYIISESGLYELIFKSRKPEAKEFKRWVTHEVLPCIRKTGGYITEKAAADFINDPLAKFEELLITARELRAKNMALSTENTGLQKTITIQAPIVKAAERLLDSSSITTITAIAKQLNISARRLNEFLEDEKVIYRIGKKSEFVLFEKYVDQGIGKLITHTYNRADGTTGSENLLKWTEKGRQFIIQLWHDKKEVPELPAVLNLF